MGAVKLVKSVLSTGEPHRFPTESQLKGICHGRAKTGLASAAGNYST